MILHIKNEVYKNYDIQWFGEIDIQGLIFYLTNPKRISHSNHDLEKKKELNRANYF